MRSLLLLVAIGFGFTVTFPARADSITDTRADNDTANTNDGAEHLTLKEAIRRALARNPTVEVQVAEIRRARAQLEEVRGVALPTLIGNGVYTRIDHDRVLSSPMGNVLLTDANSVILNATVTVPVLAPHAWARWSQANQNVHVVEANVAETRRQVAMTVASAYLAIIERRREVELNQRARDTAKAHFNYTHARLEGGRGSRLDDVRAEQELEADESAVVSAQLAVVRAREALGVLVAGEVPVDVSEEPWLDALDTAQASEEAPHRRADLIALRAARDLAHKTTHQDWTNYLPSLNASFAPIYTYPGTVFTPTFSWQAQLALTVPFYDGGIREGVIHEHHALEDEASWQLEGQERQARSEIRVGGEATHSTDDALTRARKAATLAHEAVKIAELSYQAGATTNIELIDAERRARDADTAAAVNEDAARQARIDLQFAAGELP